MNYLVLIEKRLKCTFLLQVETVLKGAVRAERLDSPQDFIGPILSRVKKEHIQKKYSIQEWDSPIDFLNKLALSKGKLRKGGEPDTQGVAKSMINDWQRGKLPFFVPPPAAAEGEEQEEDANRDADEAEYDAKASAMVVNQNDDDDEDDSENEDGDDKVSYCDDTVILLNERDGICFDTNIMLAVLCVL